MGGLPMPARAQLRQPLELVQQGVLFGGSLQRVNSEIAVEQVKPSCFEARLGVACAKQSTDQETGDDEQQHGRGHLAGHQETAETRAAEARSKGGAILLERDRQASAREVQRRRDAEQYAGRQCQQQGIQKDA